MSDALQHIQAIKVQRLYLQVAQQLQALIGDGTFSVGARLPSERDLAKQFEVSRPTIREAMIALEVAGLVEVRSGSGVYVLEQSTQAVPLADMRGPGPFEILEARKLIEGETCALAAQRITGEQITQLRLLLAEMQDENRRELITEEADQKFHCLIADAAGNSALSVIVSWLWQLRNDSELSTHFHQRLRNEGDRPIVEDHRLILEALEGGDPRLSREAMTNHLQRVIDHLMEVS